MLERVKIILESDAMMSSSFFCCMTNWTYFAGEVTKGIEGTWNYQQLEQATVTFTDTQRWLRRWTELMHQNKHLFMAFNSAKRLWHVCLPCISKWHFWDFCILNSRRLFWGSTNGRCHMGWDVNCLEVNIWFISLLMLKTAK